VSNGSEIRTKILLYQLITKEIVLRMLVALPIFLPLHSKNKTYLFSDGIGAPLAKKCWEIFYTCIWRQIYDNSYAHNTLKTNVVLHNENIGCATRLSILRWWAGVRVRWRQLRLHLSPAQRLMLTGEECLQGEKYWPAEQICSPKREQKSSDTVPLPVSFRNTFHWIVTWNSRNCLLIKRLGN